MEHVARERAVEAAPGLHRRTDDDELCAALRDHASNFFAEASRPRADYLAPDVHTVGVRNRGCGVQPLLEIRELPVEVRVDRQLALEDGRRDEDDSSTAIGRKPAGEVDRMLRLLPVEERHHDRPVGDRARPAREASCAPVEPSDVGQLHRISWYGTEARITWGSTSSRRFT
ncbi:MAG TPA: hypothetical protein VGK68_03655 [Gaiellaceae bacterium]